PGIPSGCQKHDLIRPSLVRDEIRGTVVANAPDAIELFHGYTYSGHPLASAAAMAALDVYEAERLFERARNLEPVLEQALHALADKPNVIDVRNFGLAGAVELAPRDGAAGARGSEAFGAAFDRGVLVRATGDIVAVAPPLVVAEEEVKTIAAVLGSVLDELG
ncbi:MAG: aminotransferase class III-fold pyridoxal phosphate-dependent enzyme, partial [Gammaproteobacteria bacterium]|nr:aminotransferase class III-fold pyridoxal phosphate-dependent enzyme [Gammaproteobacteria bacterium]